jgi:hypothetical protein
VNASRSVFLLLALAGLVAAAQVSAQGRSPATPPPNPTPWPTTSDPATSTPAGPTGTAPTSTSPDRSFSLGHWAAAQAYPAPAPLKRYPICRKGQYDKCMQRGGR